MVLNELLIILVVVLLIFGPKNLPKLGKMFGKTMNELQGRAWRTWNENGRCQANAETKTEEG
ncbi:MAG: twin-arginine translocase TatA/TatE family subunit [Faecalibacterium prausnitzii]